jgi:HEAT repeat protein
MTQNLSQIPDITTEFIQLALANPTLLDNSNDLTKYIVAKCLSDNKAEESTLSFYINNVSNNSLTYQHLYGRLWLIEYSEKALIALDKEKEIRVGRFIILKITKNEDKKLEKSSTVESDEENDSDHTKLSMPEAFIKIAKENQILILLGEAGSGKTTTLKHYFQYCLSHFKPNDPEQIIPVLVPLNEYEIFSEITSLIMVSVNKVFNTLPLDKKSFNLDDYKFLYIFDGLDEVPYKLRRKAAKELGCLLENQKDSVIISCRSGDYLNHFDEIDCDDYTLNELNDGQIIGHLSFYFDKDAENIFNDKIKLNLNNSEQEIEEQNIYLMAKNPFLLDCIIEIIKIDPIEDLPTNKGALIKKFVEIIIVKSVRQRVDLYGVKPHIRDTFLGYLAFKMVKKGTLVYYQKYIISLITDWTPISQELSNKHEIDVILLSAENNRLLKSGSSDGDAKFINSVLRDYFAASFIKSDFYEKSKRIEDKIEELLEFTKWDDVISMLVGIVDDETSDKIIKLLTDLDPFFSAKCFPLARTVNPVTEDELISVLVSKIKCDGDRFFINKEAISSLANMKSNKSLNRLIKLIEDCEDDYELSYLVEGLGETKSKKAVDILVNLKNESESVLCSVVDALNNIKPKNLAELLMGIIRSYNGERIRSDAIDVLGELRDKSVVDELIELIMERNHELVEDSLIKALANIDIERTINKFVRMIEKKKNIRNLISYLNEIGEINPRRSYDVLVTLMNKSENKTMLRYKKSILDKIKPMETEERIRALIKGDAGINHSSFIVHLIDISRSRTNSRKAVDYLTNLIAKSKNLNAISKSVMALCYFESERAVGALIKLLSEVNNEDVLEEVAYVIGMIKSDNAIEPLIELLTDETNELAVLYAIDSLGIMRANEAVEPLIILFNKKKNAKNRKRVLLFVIKAIGKIGTDDAVEPLTKFIADRNNEEYFSAVYSALGLIQSENAVESIVKSMYETEDVFNQYLAIKALGKIGSERAVKPIIRFFVKQKTDFFLDSTVSALGRIQSDTGARFLVKLFKNDQSEEIMKRVRESLISIKSDKIIKSLNGLMIDNTDVSVRSRALDTLIEIVYLRSDYGETERIVKLMKLYNYSENIHGFEMGISGKVEEIKQATGRRYLKELKNFP